MDTAKIIDLHTHQTSSNSIYNVILGKNEVPEKGYYSVGIHPKYFLKDEESVKLLKQLAQHQHCIAIGECGLDKTAITDLGKQIPIFLQHITLAEELQKPLIIHCVKAHNELLKIKNDVKCTVPWIIHGFNQNIEVGKRLVEAGFYFSLGKALLQPHSNASQFVNTIALDKVFLETDDATIPIEEIFRAVSKTLRISEEKLRVVLNSNFAYTFSSQL